MYIFIRIRIKKTFDVNHVKEVHLKSTTPAIISNNFRSIASHLDVFPYVSSFRTRLATYTTQS